MSGNHNSPDKTKPIVILGVSIALGFVTGWLLLKGDLTQLTKPDRPSTFPTNFQTVKNVPKGLFYYGGGSTWGQLRQNVEPAIETVHPQFQLNYKFPPGGDRPTSGKGIAMLLENQIDFALSSRPVTKAEHLEARERGFKLKEIAVGIDGSAIAVNRNLPISNLTVQQFCQIYDGTITNWRQVGGPDLQILPYLKPDQLNVYCPELKGIPESIELVTETTTALQKVHANLGSIYWSSASLLVPQCSIKTLSVNRVTPYADPGETPENCPDRRNQPNLEAFRNQTYPLTRRLWIVVKENGLDAQTAGETYAALLLTDEGQSHVQDVGFVNIK